MPNSQMTSSPGQGTHGFQTLAILLLCLQPALLGNSIPLGYTPVAGGDPIYTLSASDTVVGAFGWSVSTPSLITATTNFSSFLSTTSSGGCTISGATINNPQSANPFIETFFSPDCNPLGLPGVGLGFSEVAQTFSNAGPLSGPGTYHPLDLPKWTLTITAVPEPNTLFLLGSLLLGVGLCRKRLG
jgi:hypothetical protein